MERADLNDVAAAIHAAIIARTDRISGQRISLPPLPKLSDRMFGQPDGLKAIRHFESAIEVARAGPLAQLADLLAETKEQFQWNQNPAYTEERVGRHFLDNYLMGVLSGPGGPMDGPFPNSGLVLLGPGTLYADHHHAAREVYLVLTPGAQWSLDSGPWFDVEAGDLIFHKSWQMHATRAGSVPFLAFASWLDPGERATIRI